MNFAPDHIFHIYNRGNNSQRIFFQRKNYLFFLKKIRTHLLPHCDILAWCLMPNHFHLMVYVKKLEIDFVHRESRLSKKRNLNDSLAVVLRSYTRAINIQEGRTGSLFQNRTKAICVTDINSNTPAWFQSEYGTIINIADPEKEYPQVLFDYIHENPINEKLVSRLDDWEFSSFLDYSGKRNGDLINRELAREFGLLKD
ncbi:hypothetical protein [Draconibacterium mangrovi]|uniref:hypothetical protein n=1 Tax=Draconibacterium mangrovi TaxID=2697469 RepID=UPI0013D4A2E7|nr:hypothetical protein [Draconibacterium mangrovi]